MLKTIEIHTDKSVYPNDLVIGNEGEKGVNTLLFDIDKNIPNMKWYLIMDDRLYPIKAYRLTVDETMTEAGARLCYVIGSNAHPGHKLNEGTLYFKSDKIIMRVGG